MILQITKKQSFTHFGDSSLKWPNSASCFADGRIAIADSGHDRVVVLSAEGTPLWSGGGRGFALSHLREPIGVFVTPNQYLIVSDWHNHRLVVYTTDLQVSHQLGHLGRLTPVKNIKDFVRIARSFLGNIAIGQFGVDRYFTHGKPQHAKNWFSLSMMLRGLGYYAAHPQKLYKIFCDSDLAMLKPNGAVFPVGHMLITQKDFQCLSLYKFTEDSWKTPEFVRHLHKFGPDNADRFDRLANLTMDAAGNIYVCDQQNYRIALFSPNLEYIRQYDYSRERPDGPFSCCIIDETYLAAVAGFTLEIRYIDTDEIVHEDSGFDETHGIAWDRGNRFLYVVDRSGHAVHQLHVSKGRSE